MGHGGAGQHRWHTDHGFPDRQAGNQSLRQHGGVRHRSHWHFRTWYAVERTLSIHTIITTRRELFYWAAILFTFALGTAAGDLATEALGLGFNVGVTAFSALIAAIGAAYALGGDAVLTFWLAYILTRPLDASLGDLLSQAREYGGLGLGTIYTSLAFLTVIVALVAWLSFDGDRRRKAEALMSE